MTNSDSQISEVIALNTSFTLFSSKINVGDLILHAAFLLCLVYMSPRGQCHYLSFVQCHSDLYFQTSSAGKLLSLGVRPINMKNYTDIIRPLQCYNFLPLNVKGIIDSRDTKCENGLKGGGYGPENRTSDIPIWSHITFGLLKLGEIILTCRKPPQNVFVLGIATTNDCFHIRGKNFITFKAPITFVVKGYNI